MSTKIVLPRMMHIGRDASQKLVDVLRDLQCHSPLIITDKMMVKLGYAEKVQGILQAVNIQADIFDDTIPEPTASSIALGVNKIRGGDYDVVIALGGGSSIDSAKAMAVVGKFGGTVREYRFPRQVNEIGLPIIAIPTTAGTGTEVTRFTIITDDATQEKMLCVGTAFMPIAAIIDYSMTLSLPARITADTGIDALTHAIEAYVSQKANPFSDQQALAAMKLIAPNLKAVYHDGTNKKARKAMMLGATLAGIAFSNASVALVHGMSRPIGAFFEVPHGLSNAMLLPNVTQYSLESAPERYADCAKAMGIASENDSADIANGKLVNWLSATCEELKVPTLKEFGADKNKFDEVIVLMAEQALASGSPSNNPRVPSLEDIVEIYQGLWR